MLKHDKTFVRTCALRPNVHVALASEFGLDILTKSKYTIVDGTFETTECKLVLTTLLAMHEDIAIPCAYLLSNSKETDNYEAFYRVCHIYYFIKFILLIEIKLLFQTIFKETKKLMSPKGVLLDFEEALSQGFVNVFPGAAVYRDFFHFVQANVKQIAVLGFKSEAKKLVPDLNKLWYAPTKPDFNSEVQVFLDKWDEIVPTYTSYFRTYWLNRYKSEEWASYGRPSDVRSGLCIYVTSFI